MLKDKLYKTNKRRCHYLMRKIAVVSSLTLLVSTSIAVPVLVILSENNQIVINNDVN